MTMNKTIHERLSLLRNEMSKRKIDACIIPSSDPHISEYLNECFKYRQYFSGFTGSSGTLYVTSDKAYLITDGRYFLQAEKQLDGTGISLVRAGIPGEPDIFTLCKNTLKENNTVFASGKYITAGFYKKLKELSVGCVFLIDTENDPVTPSAKDIATQKFGKIHALPFELAGKSASDKIAEIRAQMAKKSADGHIVTSLEEIAWILNLRGSDIKNTPVFFAYMYIDEKDTYLFADTDAASGVVGELSQSGVKLYDYTEFYSFISSVRPGKLLLNVSGVNFAVYSSVDKSVEIIDSTDPGMLFKAVKNETEIAYIKKMHVYDGLAVARFMHLIKNCANGEYTEITASEKLQEIRKKCPDYLCDSFDTICGYKDHAAIIHYKATPDTDIAIFKDGALLVDSGGQYNGATTDITRVFALGELEYEFKLHYTAVCCAMLRLLNAKFKSDTRPCVLDMLAREPLWKLGLDYMHGTGHGVGYMLSVHEGPCSIHYGNNAPAFRPGMIVSDEPGMYVDGKHGIRIENILLCVDDIKNEYGQFFRFESLTVAPIDLDAILPELMEQSDIDALNSYHSFVYESLSAVCNAVELEWLRHYTRPISKS